MVGDDPVTKATDYPDTLGNPVRLRRGRYGGGWGGIEHGTYWAWPIDGYFDLHFVSDKAAYPYPDGSDCVDEFFATISDCRAAARESIKWSAWGW